MMTIHPPRCFNMLAALWFFVVAMQADAGDFRVEILENGSSSAIHTDGFAQWKAHFSARVVINDQEMELVSTCGELQKFAAAAETETSRMGTVLVTSRTVHDPQHQISLMHRIGRIPGSPLVLVQTGVLNLSRQPLRLVSVTPLDAEFAVEGALSDWRITALNDSVETVPSVVRLDQLAQPWGVCENGGFYRSDGTGFAFGPVGAPIAYVRATISSAEAGRIRFQYASDMSRVRVEPGELRWGQQVVLLMSPPREALAHWANWVASSHGVRTRLGTFSGWNSWQFLGGQVSGNDVLSVVDATRKFSDRLRPGVIQIDGGFEDLTGERESNERFPEGMAFYAEKIATSGARPGILLEFRVQDGGIRPWDELATLAKERVRQGFSYIKLNSQKITQAAQGNDRQTSFELMREGFAKIRKAVGEDTYLLNNDLKPNRAALGHVDAHRIGAESKRDQLRPIFDDVLRSFELQGRWGALDQDAYYLGTDLENISSIAGGWPIVRTWTSMVGLACGNAITSDPWYLDGFKPLLRNVETMTPPARECTEVLDLCKNSEFPRLVGHVTRDWGDMTVALLWNPGSTERTVPLDFREAGLDPNRRYAVWSFWDNRFLGVAKGGWTTPSLAPSASQHLRFTDLDQTPDRPVLIGSNLHIYCGAAEIHRVTSLQGGMEIELNDAGARDGDLFIYSKMTPVLKSASGCHVEKIAYAGENVWRVEVMNRQHGMLQRLEMSIQLPITKQPWFWMLVSVALASLCFSIWRYLASLRLQRENDLQQERSRIAQDLHDHIGANLSQIVLLTEQAEMAMESDHPPSEIRSRLNRIFEVSHHTAKELDSVVWTVDPSNDQLEEFARYIHGYAEDYLTMADIRCRFTHTAALPQIRLSSMLRHHWLMVIKEAIHNVVQHAHAKVVTIHMESYPDKIIMEIADDGVGLPPPDRLLPGNGLENMKSRAAGIGGTCEFLKPDSGRGLIVRLTLPMKCLLAH